MALFTGDTNFLELNKKIECTQEFAKTINIDYKTLENVRYQNWYSTYEGGIYYGKILYENEILNYLLCEKIANTIYKLQTPHFEVAKIENITGLASLNFRKPSVQYFYASQDYFPFKNPNITLSYLTNFFSFSNSRGYDKLIVDLFKLISFHIYTGLRDLINCNLLFQKEVDGFSLAPLFDFDYAFENGILEKYHYKSSICNFVLPGEDLTQLLENYPDFRKYLHLMLKIDMKKLLGEIEMEYHLRLMKNIKNIIKSKIK